MLYKIKLKLIGILSLILFKRVIGFADAQKGNQLFFYKRKIIKEEVYLGTKTHMIFYDLNLVEVR